jgi:spore coat protein CotH
VLLAALVACGGGDDGGPEGADGGGDRCRPTGGGPYWLTEGEEVAFDVSCATGLDLGQDAFAIDALPDGAEFDAGHFAWTPGLDQAAVYRIQVAASELGETGEVLVGVADAWDADGNLPVVDPTQYPLEYGLPVLFLSPPPTAEEPYVPVSVVYGGVEYAAEGKLRGASSLDYPKKSYILKFDGQRFSDPDADGGFMNKGHVVLTSTFDDNSYLRQWLAYELWSRLEPTIPVQSYMAVVYMDGVYFGLYTVTDHIDGDVMRASGLSEEGNLYKAINHDANFRLTNSDGADKGTLHDGYEKKEGAPIDDFGDLDELVKFVATASDQEFAEGIDQRVELADYEKWLITSSYSRADDSAGKNSYHYHDATRSWRVAPWDFNASFGQDWTTRRTAAAPADFYPDANHLFERLLAEPTLAAAFGQRYRDALAGPLAQAVVLALIDDEAARIDFGAHRDWARWEAQYRSFGRWSDRTDWTTYDEEVQYLRDWIADRTAAIEEALPQPP